MINENLLNRLLIENTDFYLEDNKVDPIKNIQKIMSSIEYGYPDKNGKNMIHTNPKLFNNDEEFDKIWKLLSPQKLMQCKCGICYDQVELERYLFTKYHFNDIETWFLSYSDKNFKMDINKPTHTFLTYKKDNKYYWFENAWGSYKGNHEYKTLDELLNDVHAKFMKENGKGKVNLTDYNKPSYGVDMIGFIKNTHVALNEDIDLLYESVLDLNKILYHTSPVHNLKNVVKEDTNLNEGLFNIFKKKPEIPTRLNIKKIDKDADKVYDIFYKVIDEIEKRIETEGDYEYIYTDSANSKNYAIFKQFTNKYFKYLFKYENKEIFICDLNSSIYLIILTYIPNEELNITCTTLFWNTNCEINHQQAIQILNKFYEKILIFQNCLISKLSLEDTKKALIPLDLTENHYFYIEHKYSYQNKNLVEICVFKNKNLKEDTNIISESTIFPDYPNITDIWFIKSDDGVDNACISIDGYDKPMRARSSMITLKQENNQWYVLCKSNQDDYGVPGGGWNKNESPEEAAIRELQEETQSNVKNIKPMGILIEYSEKVKDWVQEHVKNKDDWWYGYYSAIFVGIYDGEYTGHVNDRDKESGYKWETIDDVKKKFPKEYSQAIDDYLVNLSETYYGRNPSLLKVESLFNVLIEKIKNHENINNCKEKTEIESILGNLFGFEFVNFQIVHSSIMCNAFTMPFINTKEYKSEKDYQLIRDANGIRFKYPKDKTLYVVFYDFNFLNFDSETLMGMLLHEIGHNFFMIDDIIKGSKKRLAFNYLLDLFEIAVMNLMSGKILLPIEFFVDLVNLNLWKNDPNKWTYNLVKKSDNLLNNNDKLYNNYSKIFNTPVFKFIINGINFISKFSPLLKIKTAVKSFVTQHSLFLLLASFSFFDGLFNKDKKSASYNNEKFADNFAVSYGYGKGIANFLNQPEKIGMNEIPSKIPLLRVIDYIGKMSSETLLAFSDPHPASCKRVKDTKEKLEFELKNTKLSPSHRREIEYELEKVNKLIDEIPKYRQNINKSFQLIIDAKEKVLNNGKMSNEEIYDFDKTFLKNHITNESMELISEEIKQVHDINHTIINSYLESNNFSTCTDLLDETLETRITRPFLGKTVTLYHGSYKKLDKISPMTINVGTRLSGQRMSSFWGLNEFLAGFFAISDAIANYTKKPCKLYPDFENEIFKCPVSYKKELLKLDYKIEAYVYIKTIETKYVGRGHNQELNEYTLDFPVTPDIVKKVHIRDYFNKIKWISDSEYNEILENMKSRNKMIKKMNNAPLIDRLVYHSIDKTSELRKKYKKLGQSNEN